MSALRWGRNLTFEEALDFKVRHARISVDDQETVCERGGGPSADPQTDMTVNLDLATAKQRDLVNCPDCIEWMRA